MLPWNHPIRPERDVYVWPSSSSQEECQKRKRYDSKVFHKVDVHLDGEGLECRKPESCARLKQYRYYYRFSHAWQFSLIDFPSDTVSTGWLSLNRALTPLTVGTLKPFTLVAWISISLIGNILSLKQCKPDWSTPSHKLNLWLQLDWLTSYAPFPVFANPCHTSRGYLCSLAHLLLHPFWCSISFSWHCSFATFPCYLLYCMPNFIFSTLESYWIHRGNI